MAESGNPELLGDPFTSANGDTSQEFRYRGVTFKFIKRSDPEKKNEVWAQHKELHPTLWFYVFVGKIPDDEVQMILGAETILAKHQQWAKEVEA